MSPTIARQFEQYTDDVYGWAYRLVGQHHDALDVVQDVFVRWADQCARQIPRSPRGWLRRVTLNRALDLIRRRRPTTGMDVGSAGPAPAAHEALDAAALRAEIAAALDGLTEAQRSVLVAKVYDGQTFARIAEDLDIAVPTAKTHYLRAIRIVRDRLGPRWSNES